MTNTTKTCQDLDRSTEMISSKMHLDIQKIVADLNKVLTLNLHVDNIKEESESNVLFVEEYSKFANAVSEMASNFDIFIKKFVTSDTDRKSQFSKNSAQNYIQFFSQGLLMFDNENMSNVKVVKVESESDIEILKEDLFKHVDQMKNEIETSIRKKLTKEFELAKYKIDSKIDNCKMFTQAQISNTINQVDKLNSLAISKMETDTLSGKNEIGVSEYLELQNTLKDFNEKLEKYSESFVKAQYETEDIKKNIDEFKLKNIEDTSKQNVEVKILKKEFEAWEAKLKTLEEELNNSLAKKIIETVPCEIEQMKTSMETIKKECKDLEMLNTSITPSYVTSTIHQQVTQEVANTKKTIIELTKKYEKQLADFGTDSQVSIELTLLEDKINTLTELSNNFCVYYKEIESQVENVLEKCQKMDSSKMLMLDDLISIIGNSDLTHIKSLQEENSTLRNEISEMRNKIEKLNKKLNYSNDCLKNDIETKNDENENIYLEFENRILQQQKIQAKKLSELESETQQAIAHFNDKKNEFLSEAKFTSNNKLEELYKSTTNDLNRYKNNYEDLLKKTESLTIELTDLESESQNLKIINDNKNEVIDVKELILGEQNKLAHLISSKITKVHEELAGLLEEMKENSRKIQANTISSVKESAQDTLHQYFTVFTDLEAKCSVMLNSLTTHDQALKILISKEEHDYETLVDKLHSVYNMDFKKYTEDQADDKQPKVGSLMRWLEFRTDEFEKQLKTFEETKNWFNEIMGKMVKSNSNDNMFNLDVNFQNLEYENLSLISSEHRCIAEYYPKKEETFDEYYTRFSFAMNEKKYPELKTMEA